MLNRPTLYDFNFRRTSICAWRFLSFISGFCSADFLQVRAHRNRSELRKDKNENVQRREYRLLRCLRDLLANLLGFRNGMRLVHIVTIGVSVTISVGVSVPVTVAVAFELQAIDRRRETVSGLEVPHEVTLVVQSDLKRDLFHAQETRLQQSLGPFHAQQAQILDWRHPDV